MSNSKKKNNKQRKPMNPETKAALKTGFGTLVSNDMVVKAAREWHWWTPVILAVASVVVALVPSFVLGMKADVGSSMLGSNSYGAENGLVHFGEFLEKNNADFLVKGGKLEASGWEAALKSTVAADATAPQWFTYTPAKTNENAPDTEDHNTFEVFFNGPESTISDSDFRTRVRANKNPYTDLYRVEANADATYPAYRTNALILGVDSFQFLKFPANASSNGANFVGKFADFAEGTSLKSLYTTAISEDAAVGTVTLSTAVSKNWQGFFTQSYVSTKVSAVWQMTGIMAAVNVGVVLLFGLVLFLMTRGKNNPFRVVTFWESMKMSFWASFSPAVLALAFGFLFTQYASFLFVVLLGLRIMWMSMRSLRPYDVAGK